MPPPTPSAPSARPWLPWLGVVAAYAVLAGGVLGPAALSPGTRAVGIPSIDSMDTAVLRALTTDAWLHGTAHTDRIYFPVGIDPFALTPNVLDHLTALPLVATLAFPLADTLWWWGVLLANGLAAHILGHRLGGDHRAGALAGVAFLTADALLREANLHHAPQAMLAWAPLLLALLLLPREAQTDRTAAGAGLCLGLGALSYWYAGLFAALGLLPLLVRQRPRHLAIGGAVVVVLCAPFLLPQLIGWDAHPLTSGAPLAPPRGVPESFSVLAEAEQFIAWHGTDPLGFLRDVTTDTSSRLPLALLVAAALGARAWAPRARWSLVWLAGLGAVMVLGPVLRFGPEVVVVAERAIPLPFAAFRALHPFLERLTWPERWGWLVPLGLVALAARAPRPAVFAALILVENVVFSGNLPLQHDDLRHATCWSRIPAGERAVVELPLDRGLRSARAALHGRQHGRPVVNPVLLPPGMRSPEAWEDWAHDSAMMGYLNRLERGRSPDDPGAEAVLAFREAGVGVIALDVEPGSGVSEARQNRFRAILGRHLGPPIDLGCAWVWWLDDAVPPPAAHPDPTGWREAAARWKADHPAPELDVLIQPMWDDLRHPDPRSRR